VPLRTADDGSTCFLSFGSGLWKTDLTPGSLRLISAVNPVDELAGARGRAFFPARDDDHGLEPWTSDGTDDGTRILGDLWPEAEDSRPREFTRSGGRVFFGASRGSEILDADLWVIEVPPGLVIEDVSVTQGPGRMIPAVFKVRLSHRSNDPVTVDFETEAGTAEAGRDFMPSSGVLRFAPGETLKTIRVITRGDEALDGSREFRVRLENPTNGDLDRAVATGTIRPPKARLSGLQHRSAR
jgi:ELWxxDGT repeat protein